VPKTIAELLRLGSQPHNLYAVIGPGIRACHFTVRSDTLPAFRQWPYALLKRGKRDRLRAHVDLPRIIRTQLRSAGVLPKHIEEVNICSYSARNRCFSYRRRRAEGGASGRMLALIGLRNRTEN
jgi:copper oxidase (laccase) domain-containing protein